MKRYCVKCRNDRIEYIEVVNEIEDGFLIRLTRMHEGIEKTMEETISRPLFDLCLKTGHIYEEAAANAQVA